MIKVELSHGKLIMMSMDDRLDVLTSMLETKLKKYQIRIITLKNIILNSQKVVVQVIT